MGGKATMVRNNPVTMSDADVVKHIATHLTKYRRYLSKISKSSLKDRKIQDTLEAIGMTARTLQREAESMVDYDVIYKKSNRKNPGHERDHAWEAATFTGPSNRKRKIPAGLRTHIRLKKKARDLGLSVSGTTSELEARIQTRAKAKVKAKARKRSALEDDLSLASRSTLVKKAFALREKTGSRMSPQTIMKDPAAAIRRLSK
tara:strand:- start:3044 stop:3652 length:609 start_codon:yes stop_codon:yes gene_type:complete